MAYLHRPCYLLLSLLFFQGSRADVWGQTNFQSLKSVSEKGI